MKDHESTRGNSQSHVFAFKSHPLEIVVGYLIGDLDGYVQLHLDGKGMGGMHAYQGLIIIEHDEELS